MSLAIQTDVKEAPETPAEIAALVAKVSVRRLNFYYGAYRALADNNVELYKNKVTAFIGPSGCGKSTLLRILNRIYDLYPNQRARCFSMARTS
jgi:phosphate transport system ATP-binding protein